MQTGTADDVSNWQQIHLTQTPGCKHIICANIERLFVWNIISVVNQGFIAPFIASETLWS